MLESADGTLRDNHPLFFGEGISDADRQVIIDLMKQVLESRSDKVVQNLQIFLPQVFSFEQEIIHKYRDKSGFIKLPSNAREVRDSFVEYMRAIDVTIEQTQIQTKNRRGRRGLPIWKKVLMWLGGVFVVLLIVGLVMDQREKEFSKMRFECNNQYYRAEVSNVGEAAMSLKIAQVSSGGAIFNEKTIASGRYTEGDSESCSDDFLEFKSDDGYTWTLRRNSCDLSKRHMELMGHGTKWAYTCDR